MTSPRKFNNYDQLLYRYIDALEQGQFEEIAVFLEYAEQDPIFEAMLLEVNDAYYNEDQKNPLTEPTEATEAPQQSRAPSAIEIPSHAIESISPLSTSTPLWKASVIGTAVGLTVFALCLMLFPHWLKPTQPPFKSTPITDTHPVMNNTSMGAPRMLPRMLHKTNPIPHQGFTYPSTPLSLGRIRLVQKAQWLKESWVEAIHQNPKLMEDLLKPGPARQDILALFQNQKLAFAIARKVKMKQLSPFHRAIRARLFLRMARFHRNNYKLALTFNHAVLKRRLKLSHQLHLGRLFYFYWGRLLCLKGKHKEATRILKQALQQVPATRRDRVQAWFTVCRSPLQRVKVARKLARLRFNKDPDGWAEWVLIHYLFKLKAQIKPKLLTPRARLYAQIWKKQPVRWPATLLRKAVDQEKIAEKHVRTTQHYFDPAVFAVMADHHAREALRYLQDAPGPEDYALFYRAQAHYLLGQNKQAQTLWNRFLRNPPKTIRWAYLLFSHRFSPRFLYDEARYYQAMLLAPQNKRAARASLMKLARANTFAQTLAGLGLLQLNLDKQRSYLWLRHGVQMAKDAEQRLHEDYLVSSQRERDPQRKRGASVVIQLRLARYLVRSIYLWGSIGAILMRDSDRATWWMERLHCKNEPYKITDINEPFQFAWAARAYAHAGKLGVATLFFAKNRKAYPSLTQLWMLLRIWRIFEGMNGVPRVKAG